MSKTVAILAQGMMGAAVAKCLTDHGVTVLTCLAGRSEASRTRAAQAGMNDVALDRFGAADLFLSIVPPDNALSTAHEVVPRLGAAGRPIAFVDCNAVSPETARKVAAVASAAGLPFVDAAIIGPPPRPHAHDTVVYACGEGIRSLVDLTPFGLDVRPLDADIGAASALKMCYAGIAKGLTGLGAAMIWTASQQGAAEALLSELRRSQPDVLRLLQAGIPDMLPKAYRWAGEMEEIAAFSGEHAATAAIYEGLARFYASVAEDLRGDKHMPAAFEAFFKQMP
jgi:L-threonate 2-dehydrogenase